MTRAQAQRNLDRADARLRMAGVSNLGMSAIEQRGFRQIRKLSRAVWKYQCAWFDLKWAKKGKTR